MYKNLLSWFTLLLTLSSCSRTAPIITVVCEENSDGNCIVKWETAPALKGQVKIYASSTTPDFIPEDVPVAVVNIPEGSKLIINKDPSQRYYYLLVFENKYRVKVASRNINIDGIQNFRDMGGYKSSATGENIRWGMIYRSAQIGKISKDAVKELNELGIKTIIDLRTDAERKSSSQLNDKEINIVQVPIPTKDIEKILKDIEENKIKPDTVYKIVEQINRNLVINYGEEYEEIFDILLNRNNYPIVINCTSGNGRTGVVAALIMAALGVDEDVIMKDYRLSNEYFDIPKASEYAYNLPDSLQEAITTIYSARENFLNAAREEIEVKYGDVHNYLNINVGLSDKEINTLRDILLSPN